MSDRILSIRNLTKSIPQPGKTSREKFILKNLSFDVPENEIFVILGPSGIGKSTLLRILNGLDRFDSGEVFFRNRSIKEWNPLELRKKIGMVFQIPALFDGTVRENFEFARKCCGNKQADEYEYLLKTVDLQSELLQQNALNLSVGQQQRIMIARALVSKPEVLLLDEPTASLDPSNAHRVLNLLLDLRSRLNTTFIFVTHSIEHARLLADRLLLLLPDHHYAVYDRDIFDGKNIPDEVKKFLEGDLNG